MLEVIDVVAIVTVPSLGFICNLRFLAVWLSMKLRELPVSIHAVTDLLLICYYTDMLLLAQYM